MTRLTLYSMVFGSCEFVPCINFTVILEYRILCEVARVDKANSS